MMSRRADGSVVTDFQNIRMLVEHHLDVLTQEMARLKEEIRVKTLIIENNHQRYWLLHLECELLRSQITELIRSAWGVPSPQVPPPSISLNSSQMASLFGGSS